MVVQGVMTTWGKGLNRRAAYLQRRLLAFQELEKPLAVAAGHAVLGGAEFLQAGQRGSMEWSGTWCLGVAGAALVALQTNPRGPPNQTRQQSRAWQSADSTRVLRTFSTVRTSASMRANRAVASGSSRLFPSSLPMKRDSR
jgi:hypothetical protein